jgi:hypothetical protein
MSKRATHVTPDPSGGWCVRRAGASRASKRFDKKQDAITYAKSISRDEGSDFIVHRADGTVDSMKSFGNQDSSK